VLRTITSLSFHNLEGSVAFVRRDVRHRCRDDEGEGQAPRAPGFCLFVPKDVSYGT
jgi:hypothetical protein